MKKKTIFKTNERTLANKTTIKSYGKFHLTLIYNKNGRVIAAHSYKGDKKTPEYFADGEFEPDRAGKLHNSYGDGVHWSNGKETTYGTYGPYEQETSKKIDYESWLQEVLTMISGLKD